MLPGSGEPVQFEKEESPFVKPITPEDLGIATPFVSEKLAPKTIDAVSLSQNTPKSKPSPSSPLSKAIWSANFAFCRLAKYAYHLPSVVCTILRSLPLIVTSGSPFPSSVSLMLGSLTTTSTTIEPVNLLSKIEFSAETTKLGLWLASAGVEYRIVSPSPNNSRRNKIRTLIIE